MTITAKKEYTVFYSKEDKGWVATYSGTPLLSVIADRPASALKEMIILVEKHADI